MGQVLHGSATTTEAVGRAIQHSRASLRGLAKRYGINQKDGRQVERADLCRGCADGTEGAQIDGSVRRGRGRRRRVSKAYFVAARRLPVRAAADNSAPDALVSASLSAAPDCPKSKATKSRGGSSRPIRSVSSTSTSPKCKPRRASSLSSPPSTELPSSRSLGSSTRPIGRPRAPSWRSLSAPCPTGSRSCSPTMESNSPTCQTTDQAQPPSSAAILSTASVGNTGSNID
jgi:hypothetical protein